MILAAIPQQICNESSFTFTNLRRSLSVCLRAPMPIVQDTTSNSRIASEPPPVYYAPQQARRVRPA